MSALRTLGVGAPVVLLNSRMVGDPEVSIYLERF